MWPKMEEQLAKLWQEEADRGSEITRMWFEHQALRIFEKEYQEEVVSFNGQKIYSCQLSDGWFSGFKERYKISYRAPTSQAQQTPTEYQRIASEFLGFVRHNSTPRQNEKPSTIGRYHPSTIFNIDQMALPFDFYRRRTYAPRGDKSVKKKVMTKSWTKRQASVMILIAADGIPHCWPLVLFRGEGKGAQIQKEALFYDDRVAVYFNKKAYINTETMLRWIDKLYSTAVQTSQKLLSIGPNSPPAPFLLTLDTCPTHCTLPVLKALSAPHLNTTTAFIPEGMTGYLQPEDTHINKPFKQYISDFLQTYINEEWKSQFPAKGNVKVRERRILITKCVGDAWDKLHQEHSDLIQKSFRDTGISLQPDGSEDHLINIRDLPSLAVNYHTQYGLNCNLQIGSRGKRETGKGILSEDNWEMLLKMLDEKGILAGLQEVADQENEEILVDSV